MISTSIKVLQVNLNRSSTATESALQIAVEFKVDLLVAQEPWTTINNNNDNNHSLIRSILHPSFTQLLPTDHTLRPRTLVYVARSFRPTVTLSDSPSDPDLLVIVTIRNDVGHFHGRFGTRWAVGSWRCDWSLRCSAND